MKKKQKNQKKLSSKKQEKKNQKIFFQDTEYYLLEEIFSELSATLIGFLLSGRSIKTMYKIKNEILKNRYITQRSLLNLEEKGYIKIIQNQEIKLTKLGKEIFERTKLTKNNLERKKQKWDGRWRAVSFDIPNEFSDIRRLLREILLRAGFMQMQKSIYIFPFEIKEILEFLKKNKDFKKHIVYMEILKTTQEKEWKKFFEIYFK